MPTSPNDAPINLGPAAKRKFAQLSNSLVQEGKKEEQSKSIASVFTRPAIGRIMQRKLLRKEGTP